MSYHYKEGIVEAIAELKDSSGSSVIAIQKFMQDKLPKDEEWENILFLKALKAGVEKGDFIKNNNCYALSADFLKQKTATEEAREELKQLYLSSIKGCIIRILPREIGALDRQLIQRIVEILQAFPVLANRRMCEKASNLTHLDDMSPLEIILKHFAVELKDPTDIRGPELGPPLENVKALYQMYPQIVSLEMNCNLSSYRRHIKGTCYLLHHLCAASNLQAIEFVAKNNPKAVSAVMTDPRFASEWKTPVTPIHILMERLFEGRNTSRSWFYGKLEAEDLYPAINMLLDLSPTPDLVLQTSDPEDSSLQDSLVHTALYRAYPELFEQCLAKRLPQEIPHFYWKRSLGHEHDLYLYSSNFDSERIEILALLLPRVKSFHIRYGRSMDHYDALKLRDVLVQDDVNIEHLKIDQVNFPHRGAFVSLVVRLVNRKEGTLKTLSLEGVTRDNPRDRWTFWTLAEALKWQNSTTNVTIDFHPCPDFPSVAVRRLDGEDTMAVHHYSFMNKHGRLIASDPQTPLVQFVNHLIGVNEDESEALENVKVSVLYGLMRLLPGLWVNNAAATASSDVDTGN